MQVIINTKTISIVVIAVLLASTLFLFYQVYAPKITGYSQYEGYSSYEEMMAAHHGSGATQQGCSGVSVKSGEMAEYGISFDNAGFEKMLEYEKTVKLTTQDQVDNVVGLDVRIDCCGFEKILPSGNCACGHHLALIGLAKYLAVKNYDKQYIQTEVNKWRNIINNEDIGGCG